MGKTTQKSRQAADRYRSIFQHSAVSLWEEDISGLRALLLEWRQRKIPDLRAHLHAHHALLRKGLRAIRVVDVNEATLGLYEAKSKKDLRGPLDITVDPESIENYIELFLAVAEGRTRLEQESSAMTLGGKRLDLLIRSFIPAEGDAYPYMLVNVIDITERRELERTIEEERALLRAVVNNLPDSIFLKDRESRFILANGTVAEIMGAGKPEDLIGRTDRDFYPEEMAQEFASDERAVIEEGRSLFNKEEPKTVHGERRWLLTTKVPVFDAEGRVTGLVGVSRDITSLREAQEALRQSEEKYRAIFMEAPVGIIRSTLDGKLISVNPAFARMMGYDSPEPLIETVNRKNIAEVLFEDPSRRTSMIDDVLRHSGWRSLEIRYRHRNGGTVISQVMVRACSPPGASRLELEGFVVDVTERVQAEAALARERSYLQALMGSSPDYIYFKDRESRFILNNKAHANLLGAGDPAEMLGKTDFDYFAPAHARKALDDERRIIATGQPLIDEIESEMWAGRSPTWVSSTKMALRDGKGQIIGTFGISRDISERQHLQERNIRLAAMVESSNDAIVGIDLDDIVTSWNKGAERTFGYSAEEMIGRSINPLLSPEILTREPESTVTRKDGKTIHVSTSVSFVKDAAGKNVGITCISRDVTEQKALQAQVIRAQRLESLGTLAAGIAHQFNNINAAVKGYLDFVAHDAALTADARGYIQEALKAVQRSVDITGRLQGLTGASGASQEALRLDEAVPPFLRLLEEQLEKNGIRLNVDFPKTPPVRVSRAMLEFVVTCLMSNAMHALIDCPSPSITLRARSAAGFSSLEVSDTGCGISPENLPRIFTPFFTTKGEWAEPGSSQVRVRGVGLSLAVCQSTVAENGGWIEVESEQGKGTTFRVWLPAASPER